MNSVMSAVVAKSDNFIAKAKFDPVRSSDIDFKTIIDDPWMEVD